MPPRSVAVTHKIHKFCPSQEMPCIDFFHMQVRLVPFYPLSERPPPSTKTHSTSKVQVSFKMESKPYRNTGTVQRQTHAKNIKTSVEMRHGPTFHPKSQPNKPPSSRANINNNKYASIASWHMINGPRSGASEPKPTRNPSRARRTAGTPPAACPAPRPSLPRAPFRH